VIDEIEVLKTHGTRFTAGVKAWQPKELEHPQYILIFLAENKEQGYVLVNRGAKI
jgi:hypothetical protein